MTHIPVFDKTEQKTMEWIKNISSNMGSTDMQRSYTILRAVLHATRDRLRPDEAVQLGAQLPMLKEGAYSRSYATRACYNRGIRDTRKRDAWW
jgi:uncharacterized protein (DUF2267 family)